MTEYFNGNGIFVFSDAAGAKACLALAYMLSKENKINSFRIFSNKQYEFYNDWNLKIEVVDNMPDSIFREQGFLFTGTSHPQFSNSFELEAIKQAKQQNLHTFSFVDHWVNFTLRFKKEAEFIYPDNIIVIDQIAYANAIKEGIPSIKLQIFTNPYYTYIKKYWVPKFSKNELFQKLHIRETNCKIILYAPDPISLRFKNTINSFDEKSALHDIIDSINFESNVILLIKPHPLQIVTYLFEEIEKLKFSKKIILVEDIDNLELINIADKIIGFYSNFLIEAACLEKDILRYFPDLNPPDLINHLNVGRKITDKSNLKMELNR
ncbi:MAG: hypothetical protein ABI388_11850 [Bacteroidia bacterium]